MSEHITDTPTLEISDLEKRFGAYAALRSLSFEIRGGEFVALLGPNGAGKSTLIKILDGVYQRTSGDIRLGGRSVPSLADEPEVGFVHQDLGLIDDLTIAENMRLGQPLLKNFGPFLNLEAERAAAREALETVELDIPVTTLVGRLSPAEKALVAVAKLFHRGTRIMFIDEVTSTLPPTDARRVTETLARSAERGVTIIMVSHKLSEVLAVAKRVIILIDGALASDVTTESLDRTQLTALLMNHEQQRVAEDVSDAPAEVAPRVVGDRLVHLDGVRAGVLGPIDLSLHAGEVVGVGGLPGSGLHDLAFLIMGELRASSGTVVIENHARAALVPPHRESQGGFDDWTTAENTTTSSLSRWRNKLGLLSPRLEATAVENLMKELSVEPRDPKARFGILSGGNKQKVIIGRALLSQANVLVLCEPTRGVDVQTRREIYSLITRAASEGNAVLVLSSDSEDLLSVSDKLTVIIDGELAEPRSVREFSEVELESLL